MNQHPYREGENKIDRKLIEKQSENTNIAKSRDRLDETRLLAGRKCVYLNFEPVLFRVENWSSDDTELCS